MDIKLIRKDQAAEVLLSGKLDTNSAPETEAILKKVSDEFDTVVLNLENLTYISSAGLRVIKIIYMAMKKKEGELRIKNAGKMVMEVFEITGFAGLLSFE